MMAKLTAAQVRETVEKMFDTWEKYHKRMIDFRKVVDRESDKDLEVFAQTLPLKLREKWLSYQSDEVGNEAQNLSHLLASNETQIEVIALNEDEEARSAAQALELADEAVLRYMMPMNRRVARYGAILTDGFAIEALDVVPGAEARKYADRKALEKAAEGKKELAPGSPEHTYKQAYEETSDHEAAYKKVMDGAERRDGVPIRNRQIDGLTWAGEFDQYGDLAMGAERAEVAVSALESDLAPYGQLKKDGNRCTLTSERMPTNISYEGGFDASKSVYYCQLRAQDYHYVLVYDAGSDAKADPGLLICKPNPFKNGSTGYYFTTGRDKTRSTILHRFEPLLLTLMVEVSNMTVLTNGLLAMAWAEAGREEYQSIEPDSLDGMTPDQETKSANADPGGEIPAVAGEIKRTETTGIDFTKAIELTAGRINALRSDEFYAGSGSSDESGRHLARIQSAQYTKLAPVQTKCSEADKAKLMDIHALVASRNMPIEVVSMPRIDKEHREGIQVAQRHTITPELAKADVIVRVTTGADTPEAKWALQQVSRAEVSFGTYGISEHREVIGLKDPQKSERRMIEDRLTNASMTIAEQELIPMMRARAQEIVNFIMPPPPPGVAPPPADEASTVLDETISEGTGRGSQTQFAEPAVQTSKSGLPDVSGTPEA